MDRTQRRIEFFDERAKGWDEYAKHDETKIELILDRIGINKGDKILDVGCGNGILTPFLLKRITSTGSILAIDVSPKMIEVARSKYAHKNVTFICDDIQTMHLDPTQFNVIIFYSMFPHIDNKRRVISRCARFLSPGGRLSICHSDPRYKIVQIHKRRRDSRISEDIFPPLSEILDYVNEAELATIYKQDDDEMFVVVAKLCR